MITDKFMIRELKANDQEFVEEMLYQAIHVPDGKKKPPKDVINDPKLKKYHEKYGNKNDLGYIVVDKPTGKPVGAIWLRLFNDDNRGWGFVESSIPELSIAVNYDYRDLGIGSYLLTYLLENSQEKYPDISLSVDIYNYAKRLYEKFGFREVHVEGDSVIMLLRRKNE